MNHFSTGGGWGIESAGLQYLESFGAIALDELQEPELLGSLVSTGLYDLPQCQQLGGPTPLSEMLLNYNPGLSPMPTLDQFVPSEQMGSLHSDPRGISPDFPPCFPTNIGNFTQATPLPGIPDGRTFPIQAFAGDMPSNDLDLDACLDAMAIWTQPSLMLDIAPITELWSPTSSSTGVFTSEEASEPSPTPVRGRPKHAGPFPCLHPGCNKICPNGEKLRQHTRYHPKRFSCKDAGGSCDQIFSMNGDLQRHLYSERGETLGCPVPNCKRRLRGNRKDNVKRHLRRVHKIS